MSDKFLKCIHGLFWSTCATCSEKTEKDIKAELDFLRQQQLKKLEFDYQDPKELGEHEQDTDYDLDDMRMSN